MDILSPPIPGEMMAIMVMPLLLMDQLVPLSQLLLLMRMPLAYQSLWLKLNLLAIKIDRQLPHI